MDISIVIPAYDEEKNVGPLTEVLVEVLDNITEEFEIIFVDDGSTDGTYEKLKRLRHKYNMLKVIKFRRNFGQTAAMQAGFEYCSGEKVITMDADLQNDPRDIKNLLDKLEKGYDVVSGWRYRRKDPATKVILSAIARKLRQMVTGETLHDVGCTLKVYKKECVGDLMLYGEMHRYIPTILRNKGYKIGELKVNHFPRKHGRSKYRMGRVVRGFLDLMSAKFWMDYSTRPFHFFGVLGFLIILGGSLTILVSMIRNIVLFDRISVGVLLLPSVVLILSGIQFIIFGFLSEMQIRNYFSQNDEKPYNIEEILQ